MGETIRFGSQTYGYLLLILLIISALFLSVVVCLWLSRFFLPSKHVLRKRGRLLLFLLLTWPLVVVAFGIWGGYQIGYCHFYSRRISAEQKLAIRYLWPKGEISNQMSHAYTTSQCPFPSRNCVLRLVLAATTAENDRKALRF